MNIKDYYIAKNLIPEWWEKYNTTSRKRMFYYMKSTNLRYLENLSQIFEKFENIEGSPITEWEVAERSGQNKYKQHTVNMVVTKLFTKENNQYYKTEKGKLYSDFLRSKENFSAEEFWIINYMFLLDSYVNDEKNYFISRSETIYLNFKRFFEKNEIDTYILKFLTDFKNYKNKDAEEAFEQPFFFLHSLYDDYDFLEYYEQSTNEEKRDLSDYLSFNFKNLDNDQKDCLTKKYSEVNSKIGQYTLKMLYDDAKIFYSSICIINNLGKTLKDIVENLLKSYNQLYNIDIDKVQKYVFDNLNIFEPIFSNLYENDDESIEDIEEKNEVEFNPSTEINFDSIDIPYKKIDDTTREGQFQNNQFFMRGKKLSKQFSNYTCALEELCNCNEFYFTSKTTNKTYLEVHHLLPREFRNSFENSIEVLSNYVPLCPRCHKMIHNAVDGERKQLITYLYKNRIERLKKCGLDIELNHLLNLYHLGDNNFNIIEHDDQD